MKTKIVLNTKQKEQLRKVLNNEDSFLEFFEIGEDKGFISILRTHIKDVFKIEIGIFAGVKFKFKYKYYAVICARKDKVKKVLFGEHGIVTNQGDRLILEIV